MEVPAVGWRRYGPLNGAAFSLHGSLCRLLWLTLNPDRTVAEFPAGWSSGRFGDTAELDCGELKGQIGSALDAFFWDCPDWVIAWATEGSSARTNPSERSMIEQDLEILKEFSAKRQKTDGAAQLWLL